MPSSSASRDPSIRGLRGVHWLWSLSLSLSLGGCSDPAAHLDDFLVASDEARNQPPPRQDLGSTLADISGDFLLALAVASAQDLPLQFYVTTELTQEADGSGTMSMRMQPLALDPGERLLPREPVGEAIVIDGIEVSEAGAFAVDLGEVEVDAAANPILGTAITATIAFDGFIQDDDLYCGNVTGMVTAPTALDLAGSTFAALRVADISDLPEEFPIRCPG